MGWNPFTWFSRPSWPPKGCTSPESICRIVRNNISYEEDKQGVWQSPEKTWRRRKGDCEDFALLVTELCKNNGFQAKLRIYFKPGFAFGHAVVVGRHNDLFWMSSNGSYSSDTYDFYDQEVAKMLETDVHLLTKMEPNDNTIANLIGAPKIERC